MKVVKHVPQKQTSKRQRRPSTPKKPTSNLHNEFTTGHANSPCTIVVGRVQSEKVSKMLNNLMLNRDVDFSEDLSGLTEMFKTPEKEKPQQMSGMGSILSNSENLSERQLQVTSTGDTLLPITSEILEEKVLSNQNAAKLQSDRYSASPTLRLRSIKHENTVQEKQPRPKFDAPAEKVGIKKGEKTVKTASQETELQSPHDGAKTSTSRCKVSGKRTCLRSRGQTEIPQPHEAEEKTSKSGAEILRKTHKEKGISGETDVRCLRSRKTSEPKPRVTRGIKKDAKTPKKDEDIVYTKKLRTRSHQKSETM